MKTILWALLLSGTLGVAMVLAQDGPPPAGSPPPALRDQLQQIELRNRALELQEREEKLRFEREMDNLQIEQRRIANEREHQAVAERGTSPSERWHRHARHCVGFLFLLCGAVHILLTVWVYQDLKQRKSASRIWAVVTLLTGLCGAAVYALVRLGDKQEAKAGGE